jgi:ribonuclease HI
MIRQSRTPPPASASLFSDSHGAAPPAGVHLANIDGASRGNPGPAAYAVVIRNAEGQVVLELAKKIGRETNNVAEYWGLLAALDYATSHGIRALRVRSDSELLVRQMQGRYKVKSPELKPLYERASKLARQFQYFAIEHVRRELNHDADGLANIALDSGNIERSPSIADRSPSAMDRSPSIVDRGPSIKVSEEKPRGATIEPTVRPKEKLETEVSSDSFSRLSLRARVVKGNLVPLEPIDFPEGSIVDMDIRLPSDE